MSIITLALFAYVTSSRERLRAVGRSARQFRGRSALRSTARRRALAIPSLAAWSIYGTRFADPAAVLRSHGPSVAARPTITVHGQKIDLIHGESPFRPLEKTDPKAFQKHVENGRRVYYSNCFFCHGDSLGGDGMYAHGRESRARELHRSGSAAELPGDVLLLAHRQGRPGHARRGRAGRLGMPEWERFLTNDEMWDVILFLYADTGYRPRTFEEAAEAKH